MRTQTRFAASAFGSKVALGSLLALQALGCGSDPQPTPASDDDGSVLGEDGKSEAWGRGDAPSGLGTFEYRIASLPKAGEATRIPWAASYWPVYQDSINYRWDGASSESASAKYARAFGLDPAALEDAVSRSNGIDGSGGDACTSAAQCASGEACAKRRGRTSGACIPTWWGICHAWSPAAILELEPKHAVTRNGVTFKVNDIKALVELGYDDNVAKSVSGRCEVASGERFDASGRPVTSACRDTNPGTWHVVVANLLGLRGQSLVEDRTRDAEVWNQPLRGYRVTQQLEVTAAQANRLVTGGSGAYSFNARAARFYDVKMTASYISESPPSTDGNLAARIGSYTKTDSYRYVLEVDAAGKIIGGEWVGASKTAHPDFLWLPSARRGAIAGGAIEWAKVKQLLDASVQ